MTEFETLKDSLQSCRYGSYIVIPLKYSRKEIKGNLIDAEFIKVRTRTMDLNENIKSRFSKDGYSGMKDSDIGCCYRIEKDRMKELLSDGAEQFRVNRGETYEFSLGTSYLYLFRTQVAFLCLGVFYDRMETLCEIVNPGYSEGSNEFQVYKNGEWSDFDIDGKICSLYRHLGVKAFFSEENFSLLEYFAYNVCVMPKRFGKLETVRQITYNMHMMQRIDEALAEDAEDDIRYVYGVIDTRLNSYRWGCCVTSQTISYATADENLDIEGEMETQATDGLPLSMLALYEKYSCLRFDDYIKDPAWRTGKRIKKLKTIMLEFKAYGTIRPANISRWDNVRKIFEYLLEVSETADSISDISSKVELLANHQEEIAVKRNNTIAGIITVFGIVSILASVLTIIQILDSGTPLEWSLSIITVASVILIIIGELIRSKK